MLVCGLFPPIWHTVAVLREGSSFLGKGRTGNQGDTPRHHFQGCQHRLNQLQSNSFINSQWNQLQALSSSFSLELLPQPCSPHNGNRPSNCMAETWAAHQMPWHSPTPCKCGHLTNSGQWTMMQRTCVPMSIPPGLPWWLQRTHTGILLFPVHHQQLLDFNWVKQTFVKLLRFEDSFFFTFYPD